MVLIKAHRKTEGGKNPNKHCMNEWMNDVCLPVALLVTGPAIGSCMVTWQNIIGERGGGAKVVSVVGPPSAIAAHFQARPPSPGARCWIADAGELLPASTPPSPNFHPCATRRHVNRQIAFTVEQEPHILILAAKETALKTVYLTDSRGQCALFGNKFPLSRSVQLSRALQPINGIMRSSHISGK